MSDFRTYVLSAFRLRFVRLAHAFDHAIPHLLTSAKDTPMVLYSCLGFPTGRQENDSEQGNVLVHVSKIYDQY